MKTGGRTLHKAVESSSLFDVFTAKHRMCDFHDYDYTFTAMREPTERLLSHHRMLVQNALSGRRLRPHRDSKGGPDDPVWIRRKGDAYKWEPINVLNENFEYFLMNFPNKWKLHQLYFYSKTGNIEEAFDNVIKNTQIVLSEQRQEGLSRLAIKVGREPRVFVDVEPPESQTTNSIKYRPTDRQITNVKNELEDEYIFYNKVIDYYNEEQ